LKALSPNARTPVMSPASAAAPGSNTRSIRRRRSSSAVTRQTTRWTPSSVGYYEGDKLMFASKVRNGFVPRLRRDVWAKLKHLKTGACPFANLPEKKRTQWALTREEMKNCVWLEPRLVAQVEFTEWTPAVFQVLRVER
jgi:ATP-dependent DNA ligase